MRLAWFTPWPPQPSGIAGRSAELVPLLAAAGHGIDVFVDERDERDVRDVRDERVAPVAVSAGAEPPPPNSVRVQSAHDFVWRAARQQYDLVVYQLGNSRLHEFIWPYLFRWPGLAVLHDARLHHARGRALLSAKRPDAYRAEFAWSHPDVPADAAELGVAGFDGAYYYMWPMVRAVVAASRTVAVHSRGGAAELAREFPEGPIEYVTLGSGRQAVPTTAEREGYRRELGFDAGSIVFGVFGALTPEKRVEQTLRAFASARAREPRARLLLAGSADLRSDWPARARWFRVDDAVTLLESLDDQAFERAIAAVDVCVNLRWPTAVETSGPWLQALAAGRPTIITDLAHQTHVPALDPRNWQPYRGGLGDPVAVAIDLMDEDHSLALAMRRLATDDALRSRLGQAGREYWEREHSVAGMVTSYDALVTRAAARPAPATPLPPALRVRPADHAARLLASVGDVSCELF